ncbi:histidine kinase [Niabella drilacis]|uniref:Extracellular solute-binding protein, family 3 n=1 Tax=Niabella drilacis (strain DSM 25811 / CCM 8410 / CCUG 62505 / LMG 26954 / E90) TaxID=1285928 RepID=A0A1G6LBT3_NIADE|nr:histidine kinase [Niabella drilacis]SDC40638.1 extracellular solute-binding protein, family 3 [Niabella drilacis]
MPLIKQLACCLLLFLCVGIPASAQQESADSWQTVRTRQAGTITVLWDRIEPFIYPDARGRLMGVEYELMEGFKTFLKNHYQVNLEIRWKEIGNFAQIYPRIRDTKQAGLFAVSYYSITDERKKEVRFSPPYMPDLNILVTNSQEPTFATTGEFRSRITGMHGYTQPGTTMETDLKKIRENYYPSLPISYNTKDDYAILGQVSGQTGAFAYVPVSIYVVALQKGYKIKRQRLFDIHREGFAAIYPKNSDWEEPVSEYFNSAECKFFVNSLIRKYLGPEVAPVILEVSVPQDDSGHTADIDLLTKEREIVTQRLTDAAVELQQQQSIRNMTLLLLGCLVLFAVLLYGRVRIKQRMNRLLKQRNQLISVQNTQIEQMNHMLKLKVLQTRMNPHFLFNSLNSIQYFIVANDRKVSLQYIKRFSSFLRKLIRFGDEVQITVQDEAALLKEYLWLEQTRFPGQLDYEVTTDASAVAMQVLPLLTHSLVEKVLYNEIISHYEKGTISIIFRASDSGLSVTVNGKGAGAPRTPIPGSEDTTGRADEDTLIKRVRLFNKQQKQKILLTREAAGNTVTARIEIPQPLFDHPELAQPET